MSDFLDTPETKPDVSQTVEAFQPNNSTPPLQRVSPNELNFGTSAPGNPLIDRPLNLPDVDRPLTSNPNNYPRLYSNPNAASQDARIQRESSTLLDNAYNSSIDAVKRANQIEADRTTRLAQSTEMTRKAIEALKSEQNEGLAAIFFGREKDYSNNREVNLGKGSFGEQGGGISGFLGYVFGTLSGVAASANAELFRGITPDNPNRSYQAGSEFLRASADFGLSGVPEVAKLTSNKQRPGYAMLNFGTALRIGSRLARAYEGLRDLDASPDTRQKRTIIDLLPRSIQSILVASSPQNWGIGLNPFVNDIKLNNKTAQRGFIRNAADVITQGRKFEDSNNPFTVDGMFYDPKRLDDKGNDTYSMAQKAASGLWNSIINPGDGLTDALLLKPLISPIVKKGFGKAISALPFRKRVINETLPSVTKANRALKRVDEVLANARYKLPDNVEGEAVSAIINKAGGVQKARALLPTLDPTSDEYYKLVNALNINEVRRAGKRSFQKGTVFTPEQQARIDRTVRTNVNDVINNPENYLPPKTVNPEAVAETGLAISEVSAAGVTKVTPTEVPVQLPKMSNAELLNATPRQILRSEIPAVDETFDGTVFQQIQNVSRISGVPDRGAISEYLTTGTTKYLNPREKRRVDNAVLEIAKAKVQSAVDTNLDLLKEQTRGDAVVRNMAEKVLQQPTINTAAEVRIRQFITPDPWDNPIAKQSIDLADEVADFINETARKQNLITSQPIDDAARNIDLQRIVPKGKDPKVKEIYDYLTKVTEKYNGEIPAKEISRLFRNTIRDFKASSSGAKAPPSIRLIRKLYDADIPLGSKRDKAWLDKFVSKIIPDFFSDDSVAAVPKVQEIVEQIVTPEITKAVAEAQPNVVSAVANDIASGVIDSRNAGEVIQAINLKLANPEVTIVSVPVKRGAGRPRKVPSTVLINGVSEQELARIDDVIVQVNIADLAQQERAAQAVRQILNIPDDFDVIPSRAKTTFIQLKGNPSVRVLVKENSLEYVVKGNTVVLPNTVANVQQALETVAKNAPNILPLDEITRLAGTLADSVDNLEIKIPTITKVSEAINLGEIKIPGTTRKQFDIAHGSVLRSDGSLVTNVIDVTKGIGNINPKAGKLAVPTKLGLITFDEIAALPKEIKATILDDLQSIRLEVINGLNDLNNKGYKAVGIPKFVDRRLSDKVNLWQTTILPDRAPLITTPLKVEDIRQFQPGSSVGFHGTAVADWQPVRNVGTESINRLGFGTYVSPDFEYGLAASQRFYDTTLDSAIPLSNPKVYDLVAKEAVTFVIAEDSRVQTQAIKEFMQATLPDNFDMGKLFNTPMNINIKQAYDKIIDASITKGVLNEEKARFLLASMDEYLTRLGYDGVQDKLGRQLKILNVDKFDAVLSANITKADTDKLSLLDAAVKNFQVEQVNMYGNKLDWSRAVDDKYELLKQVNSQLDDQIRTASEVRVAQVVTEETVNNSNQFHTSLKNAASNITDDAQYMDDLENLGAKILPDDPCGI
jgi:hypothetical protein